jgi:predicted double-glycine peptidase
MLSIIISMFATIYLGMPIPVQATQIKETIPPSIIQPRSTTTPSLIEKPIPVVKKTNPIIKTPIPDVTFYSQFKDIQSPEWKKVGCGVTSLAMIIDYYKPDTVVVNTLLKQGIAGGAYLKNVGWTYKGLISLGNKYGLDGDSYDLASQSDKSAMEKFESYLKDGPVIASIHYKFDPKSTIPHLVVITGIENGVVYYNDPASTIGGKTISEANLLKAWKKRFIVIRPV